MTDRPKGNSMKFNVVAILTALLCSSAASAQSTFCFPQNEDRPRIGLVADNNNYPAAGQIVGSYRFAGVTSGYVSVDHETKFFEYSEQDPSSLEIYESIDPFIGEIFSESIPGMLRLLTEANIDVTIIDGRNFGMSLFGGSYDGLLTIWPTGQVTPLDKQMAVSIAEAAASGISVSCDLSEIAPLRFSSFVDGAELIVYPLNADSLAILASRSIVLGGHTLSFGFIFFAEKN